MAAPYYITELKEALQGAEVIVAEVSSFGVDWFTENILPILLKGALMMHMDSILNAEAPVELDWNAFGEF